MELPKGVKLNLIGHRRSAYGSAQAEASSSFLCHSIRCRDHFVHDLSFEESNKMNCISTLEFETAD